MPRCRRRKSLDRFQNIANEKRRTFAAMFAPMGDAIGKNPVIQLDILSTALAAAVVEADPAWKLDGDNLLPYLTGENSQRPHETLYWRFGHQWAIRHGDWKLVADNGGDWNGELINLAADISESDDLAADNPDKVRELKGLWDEWNSEQAPPSAPKEQNRPKKQNRRKKARARAAASARSLRE